MSNSIEEPMSSIRLYKVYCELGWGSIYTPKILMKVNETEISAYWVLNVLSIPLMPRGYKVVEIAETDDKGKVFVAEILTLRRLIQPYIIVLQEEVLVPQLD